MVDDCTIPLAILFLLRSYVGGLHMNSYIKCFFCSCTVVIGILIITKYYPLQPLSAIIISIILGSLQQIHIN